MPGALRVLRALAWLVAGGVLGLLAAVLSSLWWGVLLGVGAGVATAIALPAGFAGRAPYGVGWALAVLRLALRRPEGDYVVAADVGGYVVLAAALVIGVGALVSLPPRRPPSGPPTS